MRRIKVVSLFDGKSCGQVALERVDIPIESYKASEVDKNPIKVTQRWYPDTEQLGGVEEVDGTKLGSVDLLIGGSPCQSFSNAGKRDGFVGKSGL